MIAVGSKARRGSGEKNPVRKGFVNVDVTSGSVKKVLNPITKEKHQAYKLSPIKGDTFPVVAHDGLVFNNFEMYWQANKAFKHLGHVGEDGEPTKKFFAWREKWAKVKWAKSNKYKRRLPDTKGHIPEFGYYGGKKLDYVASRKYYVMKYFEVIKNLPVIEALKQRILNGENVMILDGDGPPLSDYPEGILVDGCEKILEKFRDTTRPFGHGYIIAIVLYFMIELEKGR